MIYEKFILKEKVSRSGNAIGEYPLLLLPLNATTSQSGSKSSLKSFLSKKSLNLLIVS